MGIYLNPSNEMFERALRTDIYVDKSELIAFTNAKINTEHEYICVSRPRRFGKSMTANMLAAYYGKGCDSSALFAPLKIANADMYEEHLNQYDVIYLDIQLMLARAKSIHNLISYIEKRVIGELENVYGTISLPCDSLSDAMDIIYNSTNYDGRGFVFIVDEWDCIFREAKGNKEAQKEYLDFLKGLWKGQRCVKLVYMTGILPVKKYGTHSALNLFKEYSMTKPSQLTRFIGFTEDEVKELCTKYQMDFDEAKRWYDGYRFEKTEHIYNPMAVVNAMMDRSFQNYWTSTETYEALSIYIDMDYDGLREDVIRMIGGEHITADVSMFQNDMTTFKSKDDILALLVHLGYLAYDSEQSEVFVPNEEIRAEFYRAVKGNRLYEVINSIRSSKELLEATLRMDADAVAAGIDAVHTEMTSILNYNNENALSCVINLAYYSAREEYTFIREYPTGKGFADIVFLPRKNTTKPAIVVELKWDQTAKGALKQIKEKDYAAALANYIGEVLLVGINYDKETKKHTCLIEKMSMQTPAND
ncbi:MAG: ATP-binding protein [Clostridium sp.]|jgi:hypothetical protein|nr:ATP-binding protein [Clostridium sp.]